MTLLDSEKLASVEGNAGTNKLRHLVSLTLTKTADALIDPKLMLTWLITALGAPAYLTGGVVPIREAGALLPQPLVANWVEDYKLRKIFWSLGAAIQGTAAAAIALIAFSFEGALSGWLILAALVMFSMGRAIASTTYKDALARTVDQGERGSVTGWAGSIAAFAGLAFGASMAFDLWGEVSVNVVAGAILTGGVLFIIAAAVFLWLTEDPEENEKPQPETVKAFLEPLKEDSDFRNYVITRALLTVTALAPPFIVLTAAGGEENSLQSLGPLVIASGLAAILSSAVWGKVSDKSPRYSLAIGGAIAAVAYTVMTLIIVIEGDTIDKLIAASALFVAQIGYQGVRSGRSIYLTDTTSDENRLRYTALSNILIGAVLLTGFALGGIAHIFGAGTALAICAVFSVFGVISALRLKGV